MKFSSFASASILAIVAMSSAAQATTFSQVLATNPNFTKLSAAVKAAGLEQAAVDLKDATVFAPTDRAFDFLTVGQTRELFANPAKLRKLLLNHIVPGAYTMAELVDGRVVKSLAGYDIQGLKLINGDVVYSAKVATKCVADGKKLTLAEIIGSPEITNADNRLENNVILQGLDQVSAEPIPGRGADVGVGIGQPQFVGLACGLLN